VPRTDRQSDKETLLIVKLLKLAQAEHLQNDSKSPILDELIEDLEEMLKRP